MSKFWRTGECLGFGRWENVWDLGEGGYLRFDGSGNV